MSDQVSDPAIPGEGSGQAEQAVDARSAGKARSLEALRRHQFAKGQSGNPGGVRKNGKPSNRVPSLRNMLYRVFLENEAKAAEVFKQRLLSPRHQQECLEMLGRLTKELGPQDAADTSKVAVIVLGGGAEHGLGVGMFRQALDGAQSQHTAEIIEVNQEDTEG